MELKCDIRLCVDVARLTYQVLAEGGQLDKLVVPGRMRMCPDSETIQLPSAYGEKSCISFHVML
ncbi:hypothetical protein E2C01_048173 [Portunus trituberculatus]|uniref:Uncharacterized protein n=1 Tax=Portunus trituberculatus TaxID=210409 RepID=A0A5B7GAG4_PORTR|nr:hypothetical protein [Portunus trituberculatus]